MAPTSDLPGIAMSGGGSWYL